MADKAVLLGKGELIMIASPSARNDGGGFLPLTAFPMERWYLINYLKRGHSHLSATADGIEVAVH